MGFTLIWLAGAIGLYRGKAWAWYASVLGVTVMFVENIALFAQAYGLMPVASDPTDGIGYMLMFGLGGACVSLPLLISLFLNHSNLLNKQRIPSAISKDDVVRGSVDCPLL